MKRLLLLLCASTSIAVSLPEGHTETVDALYRAAHDTTMAYDRLKVLCETIGHRLSGSQALEDAIDWAVEGMTEDGFVVQTQDVLVPHWERNEESLTMLEPMPRDLQILGLGMTVGGEVEAEVVVVSSFDELETVDVEGKIVLYDVPFTTYGETVRYRGGGPSAAARKGAVGVLVRSVTPDSLYTPHTGATRYADDAPKIPAAAVTIEDAVWMHGLHDAGIPIKVKLSLGAEHHPDATSRNVIADLPGREKPDEAVVVGCHLDSWDLGTGALDDGAGCGIVVGAAMLIAGLDERPRRTIRVVLYGAEEVGLFGATAYAREHGDDLDKHVLASESDFGAGPIWRFQTRFGEAALPCARTIQNLLMPLGVTPDDNRAFGGPDIGILARAGVPVVTPGQNGMDYFDYHHTPDDTFDKIKPDEFRQNIAVYAAFAYIAAETGWDFRKQPEPEDIGTE